MVGILMSDCLKFYNIAFNSIALADADSRDLFND